MKKNLLLFMLLLSFALIIGGCSKKSSDNYCDDDFLKSMAQGLNKRWEDDSTDELTAGSEEQQEAFTKIVDQELDNLKKYSNKKFKDSKLQELAIKYINQLKAQKSALKYMTVNYNKYNDLWGKAYDERSKLIIEIDEKYHLDISDDNKKVFEEMKTNSEEVLIKEETENEISKMVKSAKLKKVSSDYGYKEYEVILENTTKTKFKSFQLDVKLKDKDGIIVDTLSDFESNWEPKSKVKFTFGTDKEFKSYEFIPTYYTE